MKTRISKNQADGAQDARLVNRRPGVDAVRRALNIDPLDSILYEAPRSGDELFD